MSQVGNTRVRVVAYGGGFFMVVKLGAQALPCFDSVVSATPFGVIVKTEQLPKELVDKLAVLASFDIDERVDGIGQRIDKCIYVVDL